MGKSYKRNPYVTDNKHSHESKKHASKIVRRKLNSNHDLSLPGNSYKKVYESWNICDYAFRMTEQDAIDDYYDWSDPNSVNYCKFLVEEFPTLESFLAWWKKHYKSK